VDPINFFFSGFTLQNDVLFGLANGAGNKLLDRVPVPLVCAST
jgi:hypothetical protein